MAIWEYLVGKNKIIDDYREYRNNIKFDLYEQYYLGKSGYVEGVNRVYTILGYISGDDEEEEIIDFLVDIHITIPKKKSIKEIDDILYKIKACKDEEIEDLRMKFIKLANLKYEKEVTLKYTSDGIKVKNDPKFKLCLEKSIEEISERIILENNK